MFSCENNHFSESNWPIVVIHNSQWTWLRKITFFLNASTKSSFVFLHQICHTCTLMNLQFDPSNKKIWPIKNMCQFFFLFLWHHIWRNENLRWMNFELKEITLSHFWENPQFKKDINLFTSFEDFFFCHGHKTKIRISKHDEIYH